MKISYVKHADIDKEKWDECINNANNELIYAYSYYLDAMSENWDALVMNNYEAVMPITWNKKFGIRYLRQPAFTQQLGIFGNCLPAGQVGSFTEDIMKSFIDKALEIFSFIEINLNYENDYKAAFAQKTNLILSLNRSFDEIKKSFKNDLKKNIKKATQNNLHFELTDEIEKAILLYKSAYGSRFYTPEKNYKNFLQLCKLLKEKRQLFVRQVNSEEGKLLAIGLFLQDKKRIYNVMSTVFSEGRKLEANHFLFYKLIEEFSTQNLTLDFEGSEIPGINHFYKNFGSVEQNYFFVKINKLKPFQRLLKNAADEFKSYL